MVFGSDPALGRRTHSRTACSPSPPSRRLLPLSLAQAVRLLLCHFRPPEPPGIAERVAPVASTLSVTAPSLGDSPLAVEPKRPAGGAGKGMGPTGHPAAAPGTEPGWAQTGIAGQPLARKSPDEVLERGRRVCGFPPGPLKAAAGAGVRTHREPQCRGLPERGGGDTPAPAAPPSPAGSAPAWPSRRLIRRVWGRREGRRVSQQNTSPGLLGLDAHATPGSPRAQSCMTHSPSNPGAGAPTRSTMSPTVITRGLAGLISMGIAAQACPHYAAVCGPRPTHMPERCVHTNSWAGEETPHSWGWGRSRRRQPSFPFTRRTLSLLTGAPPTQPCKLQKTKQPTSPRGEGLGSPLVF